MGNSISWVWECAHLCGGEAVVMSSPGYKADSRIEDTGHSREAMTAHCSGHSVQRPGLH